jgi:ribosomal protein L33
MAKSKKSAKRKSLAYRLLHTETGHHYVVRLGRTSYDKLKDKKVKKFNPVVKKHVLYEIRKIKNAK